MATLTSSSFFFRYQLFVHFQPLDEGVARQLSVHVLVLVVPVAAAAWVAIVVGIIWRRAAQRKRQR